MGESVVGPDMDYLVERANFRMLKGSKLREIEPSGQRLPEALFHGGDGASLHRVGTHLDAHDFALVILIS